MTSSTRNGCGCWSASPPSASPTSACSAGGGATTLRFTQVDLLDRIVPQRPAWRRHVVAGLQLLGLAAGVVAIARPIDTVTERIGSEGRIILLFDVSLSMSATDVSPSRLAAAQQAANDFVDQVDSDVEVGPDLVQRRGVARGAPDARPRRRSTTAIDGLQLSDATAIGDALSPAPTCWSSLAGDSGPPTTDATGAPTGPPPGAIVLLTDGETTVGRPTDGRRPGGGRRRRPGVHDRLRHARRLDRRPDHRRDRPGPGAARAAAEVADRDRRAGLRGGDEAELADAYQRIQDVLGETLGEEVERVTERPWKWAAAAIALLAAAWALGLWWLRGMV